MKWRLISDSEPLTGFENMARDEAILKQVDLGESLPTIRLYRWSPYCISLGKHQNPEHELNLDKIKEAGIHFVKRYTGGRAVFHSEELTYSVIAPNDVASWSGKLQTTYDEISHWLLECLRPLGGDFSMERGELVVKTPRNTVAQACFASTAKSEVVLQGKKFIGSAQRRSKNAFLQHGSIIVGKAHEEMSEYLNLQEGEKSKYEKNLSQNSLSLTEVGILMNATELQKHFEQQILNLDINAANMSYSSEEEKIIRERVKLHESFFTNNYKNS